MTVIKERCDALTERLERYKVLRQGQHKALGVGARRAELENLTTNLAAARAVSKVLMTHGHEAAGELPDGTKALSYLDRVAAKLDADPDTFTSGRDYNLLLSKTEALTAELRGLNEERWNAVVQAHRLVDEAFLRQVAQVPGQAEVVAEIREAKAALDAASGLPTNEESYQGFVACSEELQARLKRLDPADFPKAVLAFFKAAQSPTGAALELFTVEVQAWLAARDLLPKVSLRFGGGGS